MRLHDVDDTAKAGGVQATCRNHSRGVDAATHLFCERMRLLQLEAWALDIVAEVAAARVPEDARVELKASWPTDIPKAARRLAGHANAAIGEPILWLIGIDEKRGALGVDAVETADWLASVFAYFDGATPDVTDLVIRAGDVALVALLFGTDRFPFVVKNPAYGTEPTPISFEVPWREGTKIRSARREDLVRLLSAAIALPDMEVLGCTVHIAPSDAHRPPGLHATMDVYVVPREPGTLVIPFHRSRFAIRSESTKPVAMTVSNGRPYSRYMRGGPFGMERGPASLTIHSADNEVIVEGLGE